MKCTLMNKNIPLLEINLDNTYKITAIYKKKNTEFLPIFFGNKEKYGSYETDIFIKDLNDWFKGRIMPGKREYYTEILNYIEKKELIPFGFHFASLTDQYWIKYGYEKWEDINFYYNNYSEDCGKLFFTPYEIDKDYCNLISPDLTTGGILRKKWIKTEKGDFLIKTGSEKFQQDCINEVIASEIGKKINFKHIQITKYSLCIEGVEICSKSKNFITENTELVPAFQLYNALTKEKGTTIYQHLLKCMEYFGVKNGVDYIDEMIQFDFIIQNEDRHLNNFAFIRSVESGKIISFAPLFDFGSAMGHKSKKESKKIFKEREDTAIKKMTNNAKIIAEIEEITKKEIEKYEKIRKTSKNTIKKIDKDKSSIERTI